MAFIKVDHSKFENTADAIDEYLRVHKANMNKSTQEIDCLEAFWKGSDYNQLKSEWVQINAINSTSDRMIQTLNSYSNFLRYSGNQYKQAQVKAINNANKLL